MTLFDKPCTIYHCLLLVCIKTSLYLALLLDTIAFLQFTLLL